MRRSRRSVFVEWHCYRICIIRCIYPIIRYGGHPWAEHARGSFDHCWWDRLLDGILTATASSGCIVKLCDISFSPDYSIVETASIGRAICLWSTRSDLILSSRCFFVDVITKHISFNRNKRLLRTKQGLIHVMFENTSWTMQYSTSRYPCAKDVWLLNARYSIKLS
jgi:hypothetical protein